MRFLWFLCLPLTAVLLALPRPIIEVIFQRGHFNEESVTLVTAALVFLVPCMFFYVARDLMTRVFFAYQDTRTPYRIAVWIILVKAVLDYLLVCQAKLGVAGISLATTFVTVINLSLLTYFVRRKIGHLQARKLVQPVGVMLVNTLACALVTIGIYQAIMTVAPVLQVPLVGQLPHELLAWCWKTTAVGVGSICGLVTYFAGCALLKLEEPIMLSKRLFAKN